MQAIITIRVRLFPTIMNMNLAMVCTTAVMVALAEMVAWAVKSFKQRFPSRQGNSLNIPSAWVELERHSARRTKATTVELLHLETLRLIMVQLIRVATLIPSRARFMLAQANKE